MDTSLELMRGEGGLEQVKISETKPAGNYVHI